MIKKYCDICRQEINQIDREYFVSFGERSNIPLLKNKFSKAGTICYHCCKKISAFVETMRV